MRYANRTVVITGVGREGQLGEALARAFLAEGAALVLVDLMAAELEKREAALRAGGAGPAARILTHACDLTDRAQVERLAQVVGEWSGGKVDALVCGAGGFAMSGPVGESDPAVLARMLALNLATAYDTTRVFMPLLRAARGAVAYVASAAVLPDGGVANMSGYAIAKGGVLTLMRAVAAEERKGGVRANAVAPTSIRTGDNIKAMGEQEYVARESVADVLLFLCSDAARNVTGQVLRLA